MKPGSLVRLPKHLHLLKASGTVTLKEESVGLVVANVRTPQIWDGVIVLWNSENYVANVNHLNLLDDS